MKRYIPYCFLLIALGMVIGTVSAQEIEEAAVASNDVELAAEQIAYGIAEEIADSLNTVVVPDPQALFDSLPDPVLNPRIHNLSLNPKVFSGYQKILELPALSQRPLKYNLQVTTPLDEPMDSIASEVGDFLTEQQENEINPDNEAEVNEIVAKLNSTPLEETIVAEDENNLPSIQKYKTPQWLKNAVAMAAAQENILYSYMIDNPMRIEYAYWDLPLPPVLLEEDRSFKAFLKKQDVPDVNPEDAVLPEIEVKKKHWLHNFNTMLQFSQAFVSPNWYQGGNNYLSMLFGFNWKVNLNQVYHPKLLFQSDLSYKLAISSNPSGSMHRYTIAEDNFQYNLNAGLKAYKDWFYSLNLQFKTQLLNNFEQDSYVRKASFLSPGDLNIGLGMSYTHQNKLKTFQYTITVSPLSYNLKTCISDKVSHEAYNIPQDRKTKSEVGSNLDFNMDWKITPNISYKTRVFMFTDYKYYLGDWQNTFNFEINKFLSTQLFLHLRYDGSVESEGKWKKFMMREILSFGLSYTFSTKP